MSKNKQQNNAQQTAQRASQPIADQTTAPATLASVAAGSVVTADVTAGAMPPAAQAAEGAKEVKWLVAVHGRMLHLYSGKWFSADPIRHEVDDFVRAQMEAGKLQEFTES